MPFRITTAIIVGCLFIGLLLLERALPLRTRKAELLARLLLNMAVSVLAFLIAGLLVRPAALATLNWSSQKTFGLLRLLSLPPAASFILAVLLLDLSFYWWHVANHRVPFLWRFHNVHHFDPDLDVSTGFRFHFGEVFMSAAFRMIQVALIGVSIPAFATYELVFQANTLFHHSNLRLPIRLERFLSKFLVTPRMHGIHHSQRQHQTNSNYGVVFPWWDRLHRTLGLNVPQSEIVVGVPGYSQAEDNRMWNVVIAPFRRQRDYWPKQEGGSTVPSLPERGTMTAAAAIASGERGTLAE
jgi:sterol desaturase/sphingolipid hydroxylase (fatty acid hydroxylase superfamily)